MQVLSPPLCMVFGNGTGPDDVHITAELRSPFPPERNAVDANCLAVDTAAKWKLPAGRGGEQVVRGSSRCCQGLMLPAWNPAGRGRFDEDLGMWVRTTPPAPGPPRPALFLDRDGVIIEDPGYLAKPEDIVMVPGAATTVALANRLGVPVVVVTNQSGIARAYYGWPEFLEVEEALTRELARAGAAIDGLLACPYHRDGIARWAHPDHPARKPRPGMLLAAARLLNLDLSDSWIVGDRASDVLAGYNAGLRGAVHVLTGQGRHHRQAALDSHLEGFELRLADSLPDAASIIPLLAGRE